ncbi:ester cyclase [Nocardia sp. NBC_01499]|uniref:ester cyclase n=1 Tax=Nocardia sp. NBC_01499 TaxID=2903597 RepID=UPI00386879C2
MVAQAEANKQVVRRWVHEVFNEHRLDSVEKLKVPDYVDWNPYPGQDIALSGFKAVLRSYLESFPDFRYDVDEELAEGDIVVCIGKWSGTHRATYMGIPPTGKQLSARRIDIVRLAGDKMTERWGTGNELKMLRLLGVAKDAAHSFEGSDLEVLVRRFVAEVLQEKNLAAVDELVHPDAHGRVVGSLVLLALTAALDDVHFAVGEIAVDATVARAELVVEGRHVRDLWGMTGQGADIRVTADLTLEAQSGLIVDLDLRFDLDKLAEQLGVARELLDAGAPRMRPTGTAGDGRFILRSLFNDVLNGRQLHHMDRLIATGATDFLQESLTTMALLHAFPDFQFNIERVIIDGSRVTVLAAFAGTHTRELLGTAPTGKGVITRSISLFTVVDGVITDAIYNFDLHTLLSQLDIFPAEGRFTDSAV